VTPEQSQKPFAMYKVINPSFDNQVIFELKGNFARNMIIHVT